MHEPTGKNLNRTSTFNGCGFRILSSNTAQGSIPGQGLCVLSLHVLPVGGFPPGLFGELVTLNCFSLSLNVSPAMNVSPHVTLF